MNVHCVMLAVLVVLTGGTVLADNSGISGDIAARIQRDTEKYRKSDAVISVVDKAGRPVKGASVKAEQLTHDFLFGCNIYMFNRFDNEEENARYKELFKGVMNYATLPFYWRSFEPEQGKPGYERTEAMAKWCKENGIVTKGHPLVWACHGAGNPDWLPKEDHEEVKRLVKARIQDIIPRYEGMIDMWDVVNESTHGKRFAGWSVYEMTSIPVIWAREAGPKAALLVNEFDTFTDPKTQEAYTRACRDMIKEGVSYDAIGIQTHMHGGGWPINVILEGLDEYARLGKPLHLTETTVLSGQEESTPEGEKAQARYVEQFYRACFSHPAVKAITWWDFSDQGAWRGVAAGLVRKDLSPKPVCLVLDRLINKEWRTNTEGTTGSDGSYAFRGFHGKYRIMVTMPSGETKTADFHLSDDEDNRLEVCM